MRGSADKTLATWRERAPQAEVRVQGGRIEVRGRLEDFERYAAKPSTTTRSPRRSSQQTYRLNIVAQDKPVGSLVRQLAERLGWQADFDEPAIKKAGLSLERPVSVSAEGATPEDLFREVLQQAGLGFRIEGETIRVFPPKPLREECRVRSADQSVARDCSGHNRSAQRTLHPPAGFAGEHGVVGVLLAWLRAEPTVPTQAWAYGRSAVQLTGGQFIGK